MLIGTNSLSISFPSRVATAASWRDDDVKADVEAGACGAKAPEAAIEETMTAA